MNAQLRSLELLSPQSSEHGGGEVGSVTAEPTLRMLGGMQRDPLRQSRLQDLEQQLHATLRALDGGSAPEPPPTSSKMMGRADMGLEGRSVAAKGDL